MSRNIFTGILLLLINSLTTAQDTSVYFDHLTMDEGLSSDRVNCILQDSKGFMWFGTDNGLNRYDGYSFKIFKKDTAQSPYLTDRHITALCEDQNRQLWIGTWEGLNRYDPVNGQIYRYYLESAQRTTDNIIWVKCLYQDTKGNLWIGTKEDGIFILDQSQLARSVIDSNLSFINYVHDPDDTTSLALNNINTFCEDTLGRMWIGTHGAGVNRYDPLAKRFKRFPYNTESFTSDLGIAIPHVWKIWQDPNSKGSKIWIATQHSFNQMDVQSGQCKSYSNPLNSKGIEAFAVDETGWWIGTRESGLFFFDKENGSYTVLKASESNPGSIRHNWIRDIHKDNCGRIWVATLGGGVYKYDKKAKKFPLYAINLSSADGNTACQISSILEEPGNDGKILWLATAENGIIRFNRNTGKAESFKKFRKGVRIQSMYQDPGDPGSLWLATWGAGLIKMDKQTGRSEVYVFRTDYLKYDPDHRQNLFNNTLSRTVIKSHSGYLWHASAGGLFRIDPRSMTWRVYIDKPENPAGITGRNITALLEDGTGKLWIGTFGTGLNRYDPEAETFTHFLHDPQDTTTLSQDYTQVIFEDSRSGLWISCGKILHRLDKERNRFLRYDGFPGNIMAILEDEVGNFWISSANALSKFNPFDGRIRTFDKNDGLQSGQFFTRAAHKSQSGELFFSGSRGFNAFYPDDITDNTQEPTVVLTDFKIFNQSVTPEKNSPLDSVITESKKIRLSAEQSVFSFEFAALDYSVPQKNSYAYMMEGVDPDWVYTDASRHFATYTQLDPGEYVFRVKGSNNDGVWNESGVTLSVTILPPWWRSTFAYISYIVLIAGLLYGLRRYDLKRQRLRHALSLEHEHGEKLQEIDRMKSRFFANISHEFRTPLTLILGPLARMIRQTRNPDVRQELTMMQRNAGRLLHLVNQLLELSRLDSGEMHLNMKQENIVSLLKGYVQSFESQARLKNIKLDFSCAPESLNAWIDPDKIEIIIYNLLSNAFKFTEKGGCISVTLELAYPDPVRGKGNGNSIMTRSSHRNNKEGVQITVFNSGKEITTEHQQRIFDRFYQVNESGQDGQWGSGIGLALSKELIELHHGEISVASQAQKGTTFRIWLPLGKSHLNAKDIVKISAKHTEKPIADFYPHSEIIRKRKSRTGRRIAAILVVEDNADVRYYIRRHLAQQYKIIEAVNGEDGFEKVLKNLPDLIISDVMMPVMNGFKLCQKLKTDPRTDHIPVILLTARATMDDKINGLETGADDYLTKPFDARELHARIQNLLKMREKLRRSHMKTIISALRTRPEPGKGPLFINNVIGLIESHLAEPEYSVAQLASDVGFSQSQLVRKLENLTGLSPSHFMRTRRLVRAKQMLAEKNNNVTQIAYDCGFNNLSYFSRVFRNQFGQLPSEYLK